MDIFGGPYSCRYRLARSAALISAAALGRQAVDDGIRWRISLPRASRCALRPLLLVSASRYRFAMSTARVSLYYVQDTGIH